ncbi:hypothetical protein ACS04_28275 [Streptomyces roseus]|uniref:Uncharacterized protein n=1 Tax=Streptomyces roseus TaxID=66430 RepID=A0A0J6XH91_9ACTN|nr:hypothetical protein ACS04_28275 [Streptomyces roseus]
MVHVEEDQEVRAACEGACGAGVAGGGQGQAPARQATMLRRLADALPPFFWGPPGPGRLNRDVVD